MQRFEKVTQGRALSRSNQDIACDLIATLPEELPQILSPQVSKARACRGRLATFVPFQLSCFFEVESLSTIRATLCYHRGSLFQISVAIFGKPICQSRSGSFGRRIRQFRRWKLFQRTEAISVIESLSHSHWRWPGMLCFNFSNDARLSPLLAGCGQSVDQLHSEPSAVGWFSRKSSRRTLDCVGLGVMIASNRVFTCFSKFPNGVISKSLSDSLRLMLWRMQSRKPGFMGFETRFSSPIDTWWHMSTQRDLYLITIFST